MVGSGSLGLTNWMDCHIYLIDGGNEELALVDAGGGLQPELILEKIEQAGFTGQNLKYIFLTHSHADHGGGCKFFKRQTGCQIVGTEATSHLLENGADEDLLIDRCKKLGVYPADYVYPHCPLEYILTDGGTVQVGKYDVRALTLPGHSKDSTCYLLTQEDKRILFSGDAIFNGGAIALLNHPSSSLEDYRTNIGKFHGLAVDALLPAHFTWTLRDGQLYIDQLIKNLSEMIMLPPQWKELLSALGNRPVI